MRVLPAEPVPLDYGSPKRRFSSLAFWIQLFVRPAAYLLLGAVIGASAGWLLSPPPIYAAEPTLVRVSCSKGTGLQIPRQIAQQIDADWKARLSRAIEALCQPDLADIAIKEHPPTQYSRIHSADELRKTISINRIPQTELIRVVIHESDVEQGELLQISYIEAAIDQLEKIDGVAGITQSNVPINKEPMQDSRFAFTVWSSALGGIIALLLMRPGYRAERKRLRYAMEHA